MAAAAEKPLGADFSIGEMIYSEEAPGEIQGKVIGYSRTAGQVSYIIELPSGEKATVLKYQARPKIQYSTTETSRLPTRWVTVTSRGHTVFNINDLVTKEEFDRENERVRKLRQSPATGEAWEEGKPRRLPQTTLPATRKELAAFMEIAEWFVKYRRPITVKEMRPLATKYFPTEKEFVEFLEYLKSPEGQKEFRQELRDAMRRHNISLPSEEEYVSSVRKLVAQAQGGEELAPLIHKEDKTWYLGEWWEQEYSTADAIVYRSADGKKRLYIYWDGTKEVKPRDEKLLPALKPFDPYKFADYVLRNNVFSDTDTFVYSGLTGTNPHGVPDYIWAESLARMGGEFMKTGDLYVVHTPGVERPPTMRAAPTRQELSLETIELLADTEGDPLRKFCCRQCGECAPKELLEEGKFPERISWLRKHYAEKHPGMWGKVSAATIPEGIPRRLSLEQVLGLETRFPIEKLWADERAYLDKLTTEIEREGLTEPITIRVRDDGSLIVWDGIHRLAVAQKLELKDIPVEFIGNISAFPKGLLSKQPAVIPTEPTGKCYEDAWRFLLKEEEGELVHGSVQSIGKRINHAWVELPTGFVWEPESGEFMKKDYFYERAQPKVEARYTTEEAAIMAMRTKNHGPWTERERKQYLKDKSLAVIPTESIEPVYRSPHDIRGGFLYIKHPTQPSPPSPKEELEFVSDSPEFLAFTIEDIGYREKLDIAFETAIARAKGG